MSRFYSYLNTAKAIIESYKGEMPLHAFLKNFFAKEKKYGSKDRKQITALCYNYFRLGHGEAVLNTEERILAGTYLCEHEPNDLLEQLRPEWNKRIHLRLQQKLPDVPSFYPAGIFMFVAQLSDHIEAAAFGLSFLVQPDLFIRIRPGKREIVQDKLSVTNIKYKEVNDTCFSFENGTKLEEVLDINSDYVVQDYSSQQVGKLLSTIIQHPSISVWDCCAASGGKSIMAYDIIKHIKLTVSDIRESILHNLHQRFKQAGIEQYNAFTIDASNADNLQQVIGNKTFDVVICDAPCSGSGTWSRTPEELYFFKEENIIRYSNLQKKITGNILPFVKPNGYLLYITCSVFKKENEDVVDFIKEKSGFLLEKMEFYKGYSLKADTMFAALFKAGTS